MAQKKVPMPPRNIEEVAERHRALSVQKLKPWPGAAPVEKLAQEWREKEGR